jgi:hypothetical protein
MLIVVTLSLSSNCCCIISSQTLYLGDALSTDLGLVMEVVLEKTSSLSGWKRTRLLLLSLLRHRRSGGGGRGGGGGGGKGRLR